METKQVIDLMKGFEDSQFIGDFEITKGGNNCCVTVNETQINVSKHKRLPIKKYQVSVNAITLYKLGITAHPQQVLKDLGCNTYRYEFLGAGDVAMIEIDNLPYPLPEYVKVLKDNWFK